MASLLTEPLFEISVQGHPPDKTFYCLTVTHTKVQWRWWKISLRKVDRKAKPEELVDSHHDFLLNSALQRDIGIVFGQGILQYVEALCQGQYDYLQRLPQNLLMTILSCLELQDVAQLAQTSHSFRQLCISEPFWRQRAMRSGKNISEEIEVLAEDWGWRRVFFTSQSDLDKELSYKNLKVEEEEEAAAQNTQATDK